MGMISQGLIVAVDGGGSKTDVVALTIDGTVVMRATGGGSSPHFEGLEGSVAAIDEVVRAVIGDRPVVQASLYISGLDLPVELTQFAERIAQLGWMPHQPVIENDLFALLRAGTAEPDAVAVVCGTGVNAVGVRADGATARFPSLGAISGDWGGGGGLGAEALWHAARALDGRGPQTELVSGVVESLSCGSIPELIEDLHFGRRDHSDLADVAPAVFAASRAGDPVAGALVDRQADEIVAFAAASITRLGLDDRPLPVVLGGGIIRARDARLIDRIRAGLAARAPRASMVIVDAPPVVGAALLALEHAGAKASAIRAADARLSGAEVLVG